MLDTEGWGGNMMLAVEHDLSSGNLCVWRELNGIAAAASKNCFAGTVNNESCINALTLKKEMLLFIFIVVQTKDFTGLIIYDS